jgi:hypothetical protein
VIPADTYWLTVVLLLPPALFGVACAIEWWVDERREQRLWRESVKAARDRHPSRPNDRDIRTSPNPGGPFYE